MQPALPIMSGTCPARALSRADTNQAGDPQEGGLSLLIIVSLS